MSGRGLKRPKRPLPRTLSTETEIDRVGAKEPTSVESVAERPHPANPVIALESVAEPAGGTGSRKSADFNPNQRSDSRILGVSPLKLMIRAERDKYTPPPFRHEYTKRLPRNSNSSSDLTRGSSTTGGRRTSK